MTKNEIPITVTVRLTQEEIDWIINECEQWHIGTDRDDSSHLHLATKLQGKLKDRGLKQPHSFGRGDKPMHMPTIDQMINGLKSLTK
tara:strand:+ start:1453 stop:1713 length:261 start_codon:yes stop_codon:yes gene_type:complete